MTRWKIEKDGTGIEKSGTGIEKSGTGIERDGTGIEKSGTGIEKSGTGIRKSFLALSLASIAIASQVNAAQLEPEGAINLVVQNDTILVSWIVDGSVFSGISTLDSNAFRLPLTEISLAKPDQSPEATHENNRKEVTGGGTGVEVTGGGTGIEVTGGGTGVEVTGGGTGVERIAITLPSYSGLEMDITLGCGTASVSILDANFAEVASFNNVNVMGDTGLCQSTSNGSKSAKSGSRNYRKDSN